MSLDAVTARQVADQFGVAIEQGHRDHLISHLLGRLSAQHSKDIIFYGGTALARVHLPDGRLSEDIDLIAARPRATIAEALQQSLQHATRRSHGPARWDPPLAGVRSTEPASLLTSTLRVRVQLLAGTITRPGRPRSASFTSVTRTRLLPP